MRLTTASQTEDLEALFDSIAAECTTTESAKPIAPISSTHHSEGPDHSGMELFDRVGKITRNLHDALRELGYDKSLSEAASSLPDARDRLAYVANLTGQAAEKTLSAVEQGQAVQQSIDNLSGPLAKNWEQVIAGKLSRDDFRLLAHDTHRFLKELSQHTGKTNTILLDIMMAQDFHDLTGQVIKKIVDLAQRMENELVKLLIETSPPERRPTESGLAGPVIKSDGRTDVVTNQEQVDDLLASLGF